MKRFVLTLVATSAVLAVAAPASAQVWLRDRSVTQGTGIKSGDFELHPGIAAEIGYDSNYFNRANNNDTGRSATGAPGYPIVDTVRLRITPSFFITTLNNRRRADGSPGAPPMVTFSAGGAFIYSQFLMNAGDAGPVPPEQNNKLGRNFEYGLLGDLALGIAPGRPWGFNVFDNFQRTAQPSLDPLVEAGLNRIENRAAAEIVHTRPGGLLDWRLGYAFAITHFEDSPPGANPDVTTRSANSAQDFNNSRHELYTAGRWRFLPRTAIVYNGSFWSQSYNNPTEGLANSRPIRTRLGLSGLITDRLSLLAMAGWGASFYGNAGRGGDRDFDSVIGQFEARYFLSGAAPEAGATAPPGSSSIAAGFTRDFFNSYNIGNYYVRNRGYFQVSTLLAQRFLFTMDAGFAAISYGDVLDRQTGAVLHPSFTNGRADAAVFGEYRVKDWLGFNATYQYLAEFSGTVLPANQLRDITYPMRFQRHQFFIGVRAMF